MTEINRINHSEEPTQSVLQWMASNRLYEGYLFIYILILSAWVILGLFTFGFELEGYTHKENLAFNFAYFLLLAICAALTPQLHRLIWGKNAGFEKRRAAIEAKAQTITDEQLRVAVIHHLETDGGLPPNRLQIWALIGIAWYFLFELFFISAWVKELSLVWQPEWVNAIIGWVNNNLSISPSSITDKLFSIKMGGRPSDGDKIIATMFTNEQTFIDSPFGDAALLFHFLRAITFFPMVAALVIVFWRFMGWTGMNRLDPSAIGSIKSFLWLAFISFFMILLALGIYLALFRDVSFTIGMVMGKISWVSNFWINACFLFFIIGLRLSIGWLLLGKSVLMNLYRRIIK